MEIIDLIFMSDETTAICSSKGLGPIFGIAGWVLLIIKIAVPIILVLIGMIDMTKAILSKKDDEIKEAQGSLVKKAIAAIVVFLIITLVTFIFSQLLGVSEYKACSKCVDSPTTCKINTKVPPP